MQLWKGRQLFDNPNWTQSLDARHIDALDRYVQQTAGEEAETLTPEIPELAALVKTLQDELEQGAGAVRLQGFPLARWDQPARERAFWALSASVGTPVSQSAEGKRLFHVRDAGYAPTDPRFRGPMSSKRLSFHTDRADVIAFLCIQPAAEGGETYIVSSAALREELRQQDPHTFATLCEPYPYLRHTVDQGNQLPYCEIPIFSEKDGHWGAHFLRVLIDRADQAPDAPSLTEKQRQALDQLEARAEDPINHISLKLAPGDILLLNNWTTFHRRSAFTDTQTKRHLLRIWLSMPNSRPLDDRFTAHFGATQPGALRGGMRPNPL